MAPSSGQISLSYGATEVLLSVPEFGYQTDIKLPFDFIKLDSGSYNVRDEGTKYDKRSCKCSLILSPAEQASLNTLLNSTARGKSLILTLPSGSGFFPFGPDKGDTGVFTVVILLEGTPSIQSSPFKYFRCDLTIFNTGVYPAYSLPTQIPEGVFTIGTISNCRMPQSLFEPAQSYGISVSFTESNRADFTDRGALFDSAATKFVQQCNQSKCAALLNYLTNTIRSGAFSVTSADNFYMFGSDQGSSDTYTVRMTSNALVIKHPRYNEFEASLELQKE